FPIGCFDPNGNQLGADSFVPGYTQVYVFDDGRTNENPRVTKFLFDGKELKPGLENARKVKTCAATDEDRISQGCGVTDPGKICTVFKVDIEVPEDVAEIDPDSKG